MTPVDPDDETEPSTTTAVATRTRLELHVLGEVGGRRDQTSLPLGGQKQRSVLAILIAAEGQVVSGPALVDSLYGERPPTRAIRVVQTYVCNLRRELGVVIETAGRGYRLSVPRHTVDAHRFEDLYREARSGGVDDPHTAASMMIESLDLWRGDAYAGMEDLDSLQPEIVRLEELRLAALAAHIEFELLFGHVAAAIAELESLIVRHPFREGFHAHLALALYRSGRQRDALRAFDRNRHNLADVGLEPSRHLQNLELRVLCQDPDLDRER